jgi:hypothetical protein
VDAASDLGEYENKFPKTTKRMVRSNLSVMLKGFLRMMNWKLTKMGKRLKEIALAVLVIQVLI